jgi:hypothetical protein
MAIAIAIARAGKEHTRKEKRGKQLRTIEAGEIVLFSFSYLNFRRKRQNRRERVKPTN